MRSRSGMSNSAGTTAPRLPSTPALVPPPSTNRAHGTAPNPPGPGVRTPLCGHAAHALLSKATDPTPTGRSRSKHLQIQRVAPFELAAAGMRCRVAVSRPALPFGRGEGNHLVVIAAEEQDGPR